LAKYKTVFKVLKRYIKLRSQSDDIKLDDIDYRFVRDFEYYLKTDYGVKINTAVQMVKKLRTMMKIAYEIGWVKRDPFVAYRARHEEVHREYLTSDGTSAACREKIIPQTFTCREGSVFV
jgi:hypothetical protein